MVIPVGGHKFCTLSAHVILTVIAWDVIAFLNLWRLGRVEHSKLFKKTPIHVTTLIGKAIRNKTAEKKGDSISIEEECDDEPSVAEEHDEENKEETKDSGDIKINQTTNTNRIKVSSSEDSYT